MKSLQESLFDTDLAEKKLTINGVTVDENVWAKCVKFFESSKSQKIIKDKCEDGDHRLLYKGKDCLVYVYEGNGLHDRWLYVFSPETIYIQYESIKHNFPKNIDIDDLNDYPSILDLAFARKVGYMGYEDFWYHLSGCKSIPNRKEGIGVNELTRSYIPETISSKAKQIIKNYK